MRKTILSLFGATLIIASMANAAMAAEHLTRHHKMYSSERFRNAYGSENYGGVYGTENVFIPEDWNGGAVVPWPTGRIQADDPRQSSNGG
jgi:hypothetical protein